MADWMKVGTDVVTGGVAGALDQVIQNQDEKRGLEARAAGTITADQKLPIMKQYGTYYNYGVPLLTVFGIGMNMVRGDWATRLATVGGQLTGRKVTHQVTTKSTSPYPSAAYSSWQRAAEARKAAQTTQPEFAGPGNRIY